MNLSFIDPRQLLKFSWVYNKFQKFAGAELPRREFVSQYLSSLQGGRVLDVGCGPATNLNWWPENVEYVGCDLSEEYIEFAKRNYGNRGEFYAAPVEKLKDLELKSFDVIIAVALLHHLSDDEVKAFCAQAYSLIKPGGKLITTDPCFADGDSWLTKYFTSKDRGKYVRTSEAYQKLLCESFPRQSCRMKRHRLFAIVNQAGLVVEAFRD